MDRYQHVPLNEFTAHAGCTKKPAVNRSMYYNCKAGSTADAHTFRDITELCEQLRNSHIWEFKI